MIDDTKLEKVVEELCIVEANMNQTKNAMKNFPLVEKMAKATEMKKLQQQVTVLCTKQQ